MTAGSHVVLGLAAWGWAAPRTTAGGRRCHSPPAILTAPTSRAVFRLAPRQAESLIGSVVGLLGLAQLARASVCTCRWTARG